MTGLPTILQIVPQAPGSHDGVGDYALTVARKLRQEFNYETIFATNGQANPEAEFAMVSPLRLIPYDQKFEHLVLHYVNYGYHKRGVPVALLPVLRRLRRQCRGKFVTIFHELYASGPPWKSAFWLRPLQINIAKSISELSDACIVSSQTMMDQVKRLNPRAAIQIHPVPSNFGEPDLSSSQLAGRSRHRWVICGGTLTVEKSLRSFRTVADRIPPDVSPRELVVMGGKENQNIRLLLAELSNIQSEYYPEVGVSEASKILASCSFSWIDYFHRIDVPTDAILKSGVFAAACGHGVIPVFPNQGQTISLDGDALPGPFFVDATSHHFPRSQDSESVAAAFHTWYRRHAASEHLTRGIADALQLRSTGDVVGNANERVE